MASRELIIKYFNDLGIEIDDNDAVLDKCVEVCVLRGVDEETFVETWMAYSLTHLDGAPPTVDTVNQMERKEFLQRELGTVTSIQPTTPLVVYNKTPSTNYVVAMLQYTCEKGGNIIMSVKKSRLVSSHESPSTLLASLFGCTTSLL